jgi:hypothetical protein
LLIKSFESTTVFLEMVESVNAGYGVEWNGNVEEETGPAKKKVTAEWEWGSVDSFLVVH